MKIIYITTSLEANDYIEFNKVWSVSLNPSNQNFHNKIIRSLAIQNNVEVISIRPFSKNKCKLKYLKEETKKVDNIVYHYVKVSGNRFIRWMSIKKQAKKLVEKMDLKDTLIITDTINPKCLTITNLLQKDFKLKALGICTDSPSNITGATKTYVDFLLKRAAKLDGFITLTEGLNILFNVNGKDHITIEGIVESKLAKEPTKDLGKYIFFGGALLPRYGVYNLIEAFKQVKDQDISLLICGHHADESMIKESIGGDTRIKYLGTLPVDEVLTLESKAIANINPRPFTQDLDRLSIPSKTLEYLSSGSLTISVRNTELEKNFKDYAIWAKSGESIDLLEALNTAINMKEKDREIIAKEAKNIAISRYSIEKVGELITDFSINFLK